MRMLDDPFTTIEDDANEPEPYPEGHPYRPRVRGSGSVGGCAGKAITPVQGPFGYPSGTTFGSPHPISLSSVPFSLSLSLSLYVYINFKKWGGTLL